MAENSSISWTNHTFNPWRGCTKVAKGCENCYAARDAVRFPLNRGIWGNSGTRVKAADAAWHEPVKWNRKAERSGVRARVFCASLADVFEAWDTPVHDHNGNIILESYCGDARDTFDGTMAEWDACIDKQAWHALSLHTVRAELFKLIDATPWLDWLLLTKRPENILKMWPPFNGIDAPDVAPGDRSRINVWLGASVAEQKDVETNLAHLCRCKDLAPVRFVSAEPLIEHVLLQHRELIGGLVRNWLGEGGINWVIGGGESGPGARPCNVEWLRSLIRQCREADVPMFCKQLGAGAMGFSIHDLPRGMSSFVTAKGEDIEEWPIDLRVRQFPQIATVPA